MAWGRVVGDWPLENAIPHVHQVVQIRRVTLLFAVRWSLSVLIMS